MHTVGLTLNIIARELRPFGRVVRVLRDNPSFHSARLFLEGRAFASGILYVCQTRDEVRAVHAAGCHAVFAAGAADDSGGGSREGEHETVGDPQRECEGEGAIANAREGAGSNASADENANAVMPAEAGGCEDAALVVLGGASALEVFDALLETFSRFSQWTDAMDRICQTGGSIQQLIDVSEPFLINNVVVLDPALKLLGYTKGVPCDDPITQELIAHGYHTEDNIRKFKLHKRFKPWAEARGFIVNDSFEICKYVTVARSFASRSAFSLIMVMMCNVVEPEPYILDAYEMFAERIGFYALRDYPGDKPSGSVVDTFLKDLINGQVEGEEAVSERCKFAGIPLQARFSLFYIAAGDSPVPSRRLLADVSRVVAPAKTLLMDDDAVVVLSFDSSSQHARPWSDAGVADNTDNVKSIDERLEKMLARYELICGKSAPFTHLSQTSVAYKQAQQACMLGGRVYGSGGVGRTLSGGSAKDAQGTKDAKDTAAVLSSLCMPKASGSPNAIGCVFRFDDLSAAYLASLLSEEQAQVLGMTRAHALLEAIARADARSNTDNYEFLRAYLAYERRTSVVAERLHMHRNNVNYRIGRIEEQFGLDTDNPELRIQLLLAYKLRDAFQDLG